MVVILDNQLLHLADAVLMGRGIRVHHADERNLRPDHKAQVVAGIVEILGMLVMGQADGVCPQLLDDPGILVMLLPGEGIPPVQPVLMAAHPPQRRPDAVDAESLLRVTGEAPHACPYGDFIAGFVAPLQCGGDGVQAGIVDIPPLRIRHIDRDLGLIRRPHRGGHLLPVLILNGIQHGEVLVRPLHPRDQLEHGPPVLTGPGRHLEPRASVIFQVKMGLRHADQVHAPVQSAIEGEIRRLGIHAALVLVAAGHCQEILSVFFAQIGNICTENRIPALMASRFPAVDIHKSLLPRRQNLHEHPAPCQGLPGRLEAFGIPALPPVIPAVPVMSVHRVPGVGQIHPLPVPGQLGGQPRVLPDKTPVLVQIDYIPHTVPPAFILVVTETRCFSRLTGGNRHGNRPRSSCPRCPSRRRRFPGCPARWRTLPRRCSCRRPPPRSRSGNWT